MKTKKLFLVLLSVLLVVSLSLFAFACKDKKQPTSLTIDSDKAVTIEVGQEYTLIYTSEGEVTVTANGGNYNAETRKFSADTAGEYVLTVSAIAEGKTETQDTVNITVTNGVDKTALQNAINKAKALKSSDYTGESWTAMVSARNTANDVLNRHGVSEALVAATAAELEAKIAALVPATFAKAEVTAETISYGEQTYFAEDYDNFEAIAEKVEALKEDATLVLKSKYDAKFNETVAELTAKPALTVTGAPNGTMLAMTLPEYTMSASADAGASIVWKLNGTQVATGETYTYAPAAFGEAYKIEVISTVGEGDSAKTRTRVFEGKIIKATYAVNSAMDGKIAVENNVIKVLEKNIPWGGDAEGKKVTIPDLVFLGDFSVSFDVKFTETGTGSNDVMALFFNGADGSKKMNWVAVLQHSNVLETAVGGSDGEKYRPSMPAGTVDVNKTIHVRVIREIEGDVSYLTAQILDDNGRVIFTNDSVKNGKRLSFNYTGGIQLGINAENTKFEVSNISVANDTEYIDKTLISIAIDECSPTAFPESDYTADSYRAYSRALSTANSVLSTATSEAEVTTAAAKLREAFANLKLKDIEYIAVENGQFTFKEVVYSSAVYKNFDEVVGKIEALANNEEIEAISQYEAAVTELLKELVEKVKLSVTSSLANGKYLLTTLPTENVVFTATVEEGASLVWKLNGEAVTAGVSADGKTYNMAPAFGAYKVEVVATKDGETSLPVVYEGEFVQSVYTKADNENITVENNVISIGSVDIGWGDYKGKKVVLDGMAFAGNVTVYFDVKFEEVKGLDNVLGIFFLNGKGEEIGNWAVVNPSRGFFEVATKDEGDLKVRENAESLKELNKTLHFKATRSVVNGRGYLSMWLLDDNGNVIATNNGKNIAKDYAGPVMLGVQSENAKGTLTVVRVENDATILNTASLKTALETVKGEYKEVDYTEETLTEYINALSAANAAFTNANITTVEQFNAIVTALTAAHTNLVKISVDTVKATVTETSFTYGEITYSAEEYKNLSGEEGILAKVNALNESINEEMLVSEYVAEIEKLIGELVLSLDITVSGAPEGKLIVNSLESYEITATAENAAITWTLNGNPVTDGIVSETDEETKTTTSKFTYTPAENGEKFVIVATATRNVNGEDKTFSKTYEGSFIKTSYAVNSNHSDKIEVANNVINVKNGGNWDNQKGEKVVLKDMNLHGEFAVSFDLTFTKDDEILFGLFFISQDGINDNYNGSYYTIIKNTEKKIGIGINQGGAEPKKDIPAGVVETGKVIHLRVSRIAFEGGYAFKTEILDNEGKVIVEYQRGGCTSNNVSLGVQTEFNNGSFTLANFRLENGTVIDRKVMRDAKENCDKIDKTVDIKYLDVNFSDAEATEAYAEARQEIFDAYYTPNSTPARIEAAVAAFKPAYDALMLTKLDVATVAAVISENGDKFTYGGKDYTQLYYTNLETVIDGIEALNAKIVGTEEIPAEIVWVSDYDREIKALIATLELSLKVNVTATVTDGEAVANNSVIVYPAESYTFTATGSIENVENAEYTYAWEVDGVAQASTENTLTLVPTQGTHNVTATLTYTSEQGEITVSKTFVIVFENANVHTQQQFIDNRGASVSATDGTFKIEKGADWGQWKGRKLVFDELVFNGSFSVTYDLKIDNVDVNANKVATFHILNTDTLSRNSQQDLADIGFGAICFHRNLLQLTYGGNDKFYNFSEHESGVIEKFVVGATLTLKFNVYKDAEGHLSFSIAMLNPLTEDGSWIEFARNDWTDGTFSSGLTFGINIENVGVTISNYKFELLENGEHGGRNYIAGSVKSKAELYNKLNDYKNINASAYADYAEFKNAYNAAYAMLCNNSVEADYVTAVAELDAAYKALTNKEVAVTVNGLDDGYNYYRGISQFVPVFGEGIEASAIGWTYKFLAAGAEEGAEAAEVNSEDEKLVLSSGKYSDVVLNFTVGEKAYAYKYQDFTVEGLGVKSNRDSIKVENGVVTVRGGGGWDGNQLELEGLKARELQFSFDVYDWSSVNQNIMCIRMFDNRTQLVFGWKRKSATEAQIGFDDYKNNGGYKDLTTYDTGLVQGANAESKVTFVVNVKSVAPGTYEIVYSVYGQGENGLELLGTATRPENFNRHFDSKTALEFAFEGVDVKLDNFRLMYNK